MFERLQKMGFVGYNYKGKSILILGGLVFFTISFSIIVLYLFDFRVTDYWSRYIFLIMLTSSVGIVDDLVGDKKTKGFSGHLLALFGGEITTGFLKGLVIFSAALAISNGSNFLERSVNIGLIIFITNFINLLDLRPGRAFKAFFFLFLPAILYTEWHLFFIAIVLVFFLFAPGELRGKIMLGDGGSNVLGATLGFFYSSYNGLILKIYLLAIFIILNFLAEYYSFTEIIKNNKYLYFIDQLGRR